MTNIAGQLTLAITGFMLLVFMSTHPFQFLVVSAVPDEVLDAKTSVEQHLGIG